MIRHRSSLVLMMPPKGGIGPRHGLVPNGAIAPLLQLDGAKRDQPEHAPKTQTSLVSDEPMPPPPPWQPLQPGGEEPVVTLLGDGRGSTVIGILELALRGAGNELQRRVAGPSKDRPPAQQPRLKRSASNRRSRVVLSRRLPGRSTPPPRQQTPTLKVR
jgi:hypothetical protein